MAKQKDFFNDRKEHHVPEFNFFYKGSADISHDTFPQALFPIVGMCVDDCDFHMDTCYTDYNRLYIRGKYGTELNSMMLRFGRGDKNEIVIADATFIHSQKENLTKLYEILKKIQKAYHTGYIAVENADLIEGMEEWCKENGFREKEGCKVFYIEGK